MTHKGTSLTFDPDLVRANHERALGKVIRGEIRFSRHDRMLYSTDASIFQVEPLGVVIPADLDDVRACVAYCVDHGLPVLARGGGTSLAGQCTSEAIVIDLSAFCRGIVGVSTDERECTVESGVTIDDLNDRLRDRGVFFAPDPATSRQACIGGCIGNNAAGTRSIRYGRTSENLVGLDLILARDGAPSVRLDEGGARRHELVREITLGVIDIVSRHESLIRERFPRTIRRNAGYALDGVLADIDRARESGADPLDTVNLAHLICGSEGTLGITTSATLRLHRLPVARGLAVFGFSSVDEAIGCVGPLLGLDPTAVELLDDMILDMARRNIEYGRYVDLMPRPEDKPPRAVLYVEFSATESADEIAERFDRAREVVGDRCPSSRCAAYAEPAEINAALKLRKAGEPLLHAVPGERKPLGFIEDNAVPVEHLGEFVRGLREIIESRGSSAAFWAHASVGVLHVRPMLSLRDRHDRALMEEIAVAAADLARSLGGVMSGEHGDGRVRGPLLERHFGPELMGAFAQVKELFDPRNLLNPGNIVAPGALSSIHERTRVRPGDGNIPSPRVRTYFDFSKEDGFAHAVESCNGAGVCRKKSGGTMCPSYMASLDERHCTRGRANALRLAISGQIGETGGPAWGDPDTLETLDLCLSCKACKSECPSNVDVARYRAEYLAQTYKARGRVPLDIRLLSNVRALNRMGSFFAPMSNLIAESAPMRAMARLILGVDPRRSLPPFEKSLSRRLRSGINAGISGEAPCVVLFADCFTSFNEPAIGEATARVLNAFGYRVELLRHGCCGRPAISNGALEIAHAQIRATAGRLARIEPKPRAIIVCEPSCLSAIADDWRSILMRTEAERAAVESVRDVAMSPGQFLARRWDDHPRTPAFASPAGEILVHGHCHQKALWGEEDVTAFLSRIAPGRARLIPGGCCGMAGAFGMTEGHYELSRAIGELELLPFVRRASEEDVICANGTSCRHQIHDFSERRSLHPMEVAASLLGEESARFAS